MSHRHQLLAVFVSGAACVACSSTPAQVSAPSPQAVVSFQATALTTSDALTVQDATMRLAHVRVFGDTPPPPSSSSANADGGPTPDGGPIDGGPLDGPRPNPSTDRLDFDALATTSGSLTFDVPQGLYSVVDLELQNVVIDGQWKTTTFHARLASVHGPHVDLRAPAGMEATSGETITFAVRVDPNAWFAGNVLDGATADTATGAVFIDDLNNPTIAATLTKQISASFALE
ncbi:MAG TPA: hypothetical protein VHJ20_04200 [Polyangia bacterium]|nr:hypothetical protein [Polyangia bacterium]